MQVVCIGDLHISSKQNQEFEQRRIKALAEHLAMYRDKDFSLFLLGDVFDRNKPSLQEISIFYTFIDKVSDIFYKIKIIGGNHDPTCFNYLPQVNFSYYDTPTEIDNYILIGHSDIERYLNTSIGKKKEETKIIFTHARCTIPPFITEEVDFKLLSDSYDLVVLGDIHSYFQPYTNVHYTLEPTHNHYTPYKSNSCGYVIVDTVKLEVTRVFTDLPHKTKISCSVDDSIKLVHSLDPNNLYKIVIEDLTDNFRKLIPQPNITYELLPIIVKGTTSVEEDLKDLISSKVSIEDTLLTYTKDTYKYQLDTFNRVKNRLMRNR